MQIWPESSSNYDFNQKAYIFFVLLIKYPLSIMSFSGAQILPNRRTTNGPELIDQAVIITKKNNAPTHLPFYFSELVDVVLVRSQCFNHLAKLDN